MRSISILALLLIVVGVQPAWAQPPSGYCRIYRCMTMGTSTYYYCLKCSNCSDPVGCVGLWNDATGPCPTDCSAMHCGGAQAPTGRPGAAPPHPDRAPAPPGLDERPASRPIRAPFVAELTAAADEPELLIGEYTKLIQRLNLSIDIPDDGQGAINALLVTAVVEPKKKNSNDHHKKVILGFAVPYTGDLSNYLEVEAYEVDVQGQSASFKFKEKLTGLQHEKHCTIDLSSLMP